MKISLPLLIYFLHGITCLESSSNLIKYLDEQSKIVGAKSIRRTRNQENVFTVKFDNMNNVKLIGNYSNGEIFTFFNTFYVIVDGEVFQISQNNHTTIESLTKEKIILFKTIEFQNSGFLMLATKWNTLRVFEFNKETKKFFKVQNIGRVNITDAMFFQYQNQIYLVVSNYLSQDLTSVVIYKFLGSHFDETEKFLTSGVTNLHSFSNNGSRIIIVSNKFGVTSSLYEFKSDRIRKLQKIDTENVGQILDYLYLGKQYVMIFSGNYDIRLYFWTGSELSLWEQFNIDIGLTGKKSIFYVDNNPYLIIEKNTSFLIFSLINNRFLQIHNSEFNYNWTSIWDFLNKKNELVILGETQDSLELSTVSITIEVSLLRQNITEENKISTCFLAVETGVYNLRNKISEIINNSNTLRESQDTSQDGFPFKKWSDLLNKYSSVKSALRDESKTLVINRTTLLDVPIGAEKIIVKDIRFSKLNDKEWRPEKWLSYNVPQKISGRTKIGILKTNNLETNENDPLFHDLLLSNGDQILTGQVKITNLEVDNLETKLLNDIPMENLYYKSQPVNIQGLKSFSQLESKNLESFNINGIDGGTVATFLSQFSFDTNLTIDNLWIETVNGVNFDNFKNSVFRIGVDDTIDGNLALKNLQAKEINFESLAKMSDVLTVSTNQTVRSSIVINTIFANNIKTNTVNGIDFKNSVATLKNNTIEGPVSIKKLNVKNNLELKGDIDNEFLVLNNTHIVGTNESDFLQRYNGNVTIKGNLILKNLDVKKGAKIFVADHEFDPDMDQFWTKSTVQTIPIHFEAQNGVSTPHLYTNFINEINVGDFLLNSTQQRKPAKFYFDYIVVKGNVFLDSDGQHAPNFRRIEQDSVKVDGYFKLKGRKTYANVLKVDNIEVSHLGNDNFDNFSSNAISSPQKITNLIVKGNLISDKLILKRINNIDLQKLAENTIYVDEPQTLSEMDFENVTATNLIVSSTLNGHDMNQLLRKLEKIQTIDRINFVHVSDNVTIQNAERLLTINEQNVTELLRKSQSKYKNGVVYGNTEFLGTVKVKDLYISTVNNVNLQSLTKRFLYKSWNQTILEPFVFTRLTTDNLIAEKINDFDISNIIDVSSTKPQVLLASNGIAMAEHVKIKNLDGKFYCDIAKGLGSLYSPPSQFWGNVVVTGNVTFWDKESFINRIFDQVVTQQKSNQAIRGHVTFTSHISASNITTMKTINGVDIMEIIDDAFLNREDLEQVITGKKIFSRFEADELISLQNTNVTKINNINILEVDSKIISKNSLIDVPIRGQKVFFGGLQTDKLETEFISGVAVEDLVTFANPKKIPNAMFESVGVIENFNITFINGMPFEAMLNNRLLRNSPKQIVTGNYFFRDLTFSGNISTPRINDIEMENVIFDTDIQVIESPKTFINDLKIAGNIKVHLINGLDLSVIYEQAVLRNEPTNFTGVTQIMKPTLIEGNIETKYINGVPVDYMLDTNRKYSLQAEAEQIHEMTKILARFTHKYLNITKRLPSEILYLEKIADLAISLPNAVNAHVVETKNDLLIHVESAEDGNFCGLSQACKCPMQQTIQISSEHSVNLFMNKEMHRVYSYYNNDIIIHLITPSISSSSECRASKTQITNEVSTLSWNLLPQKNNSGGFFIHQSFFNGFISGVKFFTINGKTYFVVGIYYDPVLDTHSVDSLVLRFNDDKRSVEEIQKIPTTGLKTISLFPTAQGVILIMGSNVSNTTTTQIFRFNLEKQQFELLREVPMFGSLYAEGVVLGEDSMIVLANEHSTLLILKYHHYPDNYYLYQDVQMDYPVSSMSVFYAEGYGVSDVFLSVVSTNDEYFIFSFRLIEGWKLEFSGRLEETKILVPFKLNKKSYLFVPSNRRSSLLTLVEHDSN